MTDTSPLPPPVLPVRAGPAIQRTPDIESGAVGHSVRDLLTSQNEQLGPLARGAVRPQGEAAPTFPTFDARGGTGLRAPSTILDRALDASSPEAAVAKFVGTAVLNPATSAVDAYKTGQIRQAQADFLNKYAPVLKDMSKNLGDAMRAMHALGDWLGKNQIPTNDIRGIMQRKAATGDQEGRDLDDALDSTTDPDTRAKLQAMKNDFDAWKKDRDTRVANEWKEETDLENRIDKMNREAFYNQSTLLSGAGRAGDRPGIETSGDQVTNSTHQLGSALNYAAGIRNLLLQERQRMVTATLGRRP
ncbi:MAG TPA: hypothetical protein VKU90_01175 [Caulobacteraceae bacterium]|nr:hypothetical protein [Caulobacteraceae bacterium]